MNQESFINIIDESGFQPNANEITFLGFKTNAKEHYQYRFSQDLPAKSLFRTSLLPNKKKITVPQKVLQKNVNELENSHMNTSLLPNSATKIFNPQIKIRSPYMTQGHNLRQTFPANSHRAAASRSQSSIDPNPFHKMRFSTTYKEEKHKKNKPALRPIDKNQKMASAQTALEMILSPTQTSPKKNVNRRLLLNLPEKEPARSETKKYNENAKSQYETDNRFNSIEIQNMAPHIQFHKTQETQEESKPQPSETAPENNEKDQKAENNPNENEPDKKAENIPNENESDKKEENASNNNEGDQKVENETEVNPKAEEILKENESDQKIDESNNDKEDNIKEPEAPCDACA